MKKIKIIFICFITLSILLISGSCNKNIDENIIHNVTFVYNNGSDNTEEKIVFGQKVKKPNNPVKENYIFLTWCSDNQCLNEYDFNQTITNDITLYAKYIADYATLTNKITTEVMKCNVTVYAKSYNTFLGIETSSQTSSGSGIIFYESSNANYYLITNNHVVEKADSYSEVTYSVEDYVGNKYNAYLKHKEADYDLAVLYFKKGSTTLGKITLGHTNPQENDDMVAVGQPKGQSNAITYGVISRYTSINLSNTKPNESNVTFNVIKHNANINKGSSGGAILNMKLELVGINYAASEDTEGNFSAGYAIPIEKVNEFLVAYVWDKK